MKTFIFKIAYADFPEGGTYSDIILAEDEDTAWKLFAINVLLANDWSLGENGWGSFDNLEDLIRAFDVIEDITVVSQCCPNCESSSLMERADLGQAYGLDPGVFTTYECPTCAHVHIQPREQPMTKLRAELVERARNAPKEIDTFLEEERTQEAA